MSEITLDEAVSHIHQACTESPKKARSPFFFLVGAGISAPSVPLSGEIIRQCKEKAKRLRTPKEPEESDRIGAYSHWFSQAFPQPGQRRDYLHGLIKGKPISPANLRLAHLLLDGKITNLVITPNFDDLLSRALLLFGKQHIVCDHPATAERIDEERPEVQIVHVHGTYWFYDCCNLRGEIKERSLPSPQTTSTMAALLDRVLARHSPLVIGYSGWQGDVIMSALLRRLAGGPLENNLYWFCHHRDEAGKHPALKDRDDVYFVLPPEKNALVSEGENMHADGGAGPELSAEVVLEALITKFGLPVPPLTEDPLEYFAKMLQETVPSEEGERRNIYFFDNVISRIRQANELLNSSTQRREGMATAESPSQALEKIRNAVRASRYEDAVQMASEIKISNLGEEGLREFQEVIWSAALGLPNNPEAEAEAYGLCVSAIDKLSALGKMDDGLRSRLVGALNNWGNALSDWARTKQGEEADRLFQGACEKYEAALKVKPDKHEALYNWGNALSDWAKTKQGKEADRLFQRACEKYETALKVKPDMHEALNNWGNALFDWARTKQGGKADRLFKEACEKYETALKVKPDMHEALYNWGSALSDWAETKQGEEADRLFQGACEKYEAALKVEPDKHEALNNWGSALSDWARRKQGEEADRLFKEACEKYEAVLKVKPDMHEALYNWGNALLARARTKQGEEADRLFQGACEKYEAALKVEPDKHEALNNWGYALSDWARRKQGEEADRLFKEACEKYEAALKVKPDMHEALNNWGSALSDWAKTKQGGEADRLFKEACEKYETALKVKPDMHEALYNWGNALLARAKLKRGEEADGLFQEACEKYETALKVKPDMHEALYNWGSALSDWAKTKQGEEADRLFQGACEKYEAALKLKPDKHEALYNWGNALVALARTKQGEDADHLFKQACEKYEAALKVKPDKHEALNSWGTALLAWARTKQGEEADRLFQGACEKYEAALKVKPDKHEALNSWGTALLAWARTKQGEEADGLFAQAREKLLEAERVMEGGDAYNLACIAALQGKTNECRRWLNLCAERGTLPSRKHMIADSDLESIKGEPWFTDILARAKD
jgi:tetratricopeptide (TPR) repeat protein